MPVLSVGVGLKAVAAYVEPDGGIEGDLLVEQQMDEFGVEGGGGLVVGEVASRETPVADGFSDAGDKLADRRSHARVHLPSRGDI